MEGEELELITNVYNSIKEPEVPLSTTMFVPGSCEACNNTGYKGRVGVFEAVVSDKQVEEALELNPSEREIKQAAEHQGIMDMAQDGVTKILKGITSLEELTRVVDLGSRSGLGDAPDGWSETKKENSFADFDLSKIAE